MKTAYDILLEHASKIWPSYRERFLALGVRADVLGLELPSEKDLIDCLALNPKPHFESTFNLLEKWVATHEEASKLHPEKYPISKKKPQDKSK